MKDIAGTYGIDLGASYTKVAFRAPFRDSTSRRFQETQTQVLMFRGQPMTPSLVLEADGRWMCGKDAEELTPGKRWKVYRNWKSGLFGESSQADKGRLAKAATEYFHWLKGQLRKAKIEPNSQSLIRVAIPAFDDMGEQENRLLTCMIQAGWESRVEFISEPKANVLGCFTGGRNVVTAFGGKISYGAMFRAQPGTGAPCPAFIFEAARDFHLGGRMRTPYAKFVVLDCGGYTLDIAIVQVDLNVTQNAGLGLAVAFQKSFELGIEREIDHRCFAQLFQRHKVKPEQVTFESLELAKLDLYDCRPYQLFYGDKIVELGATEADQDTVQACLNEYIAGVIKRISEIPQTAGAEAVILTGGGTNISPIYSALADHFRGTKVVRLPGDADLEARRARELSVESCDAARQTYGRIATAVGAASIACT